MDEIQGIAGKLHTNLGHESGQILDGRPSDVFHLHDNHINKSLNIPYTLLLTPEGYMKTDREIANVFREANVDTLRKCMVFCGEP